MFDDTDILTLAEQAHKAVTVDDYTMIMEIARVTLADDEYQKFIAHLSKLREESNQAALASARPTCIRLDPPVPCANLRESEPCGQSAVVALVQPFPPQLKSHADFPTPKPTWLMTPLCPECAGVVSLPEEVSAAMTARQEGAWIDLDQSELEQLLEALDFAAEQRDDPLKSVETQLLIDKLSQHI